MCSDSLPELLSQRPYPNNLIEFKKDKKPNPGKDSSFSSSFTLTTEPVPSTVRGAHE